MPSTIRNGHSRAKPGGGSTRVRAHRLATKGQSGVPHGVSRRSERIGQARAATKSGVAGLLAATVAHYAAATVYVVFTAVLVGLLTFSVYMLTDKRNRKPRLRTRIKNRARKRARLAVANTRLRIKGERTSRRWKRPGAAARRGRRVRVDVFKKGDFK